MVRLKEIKEMIENNPLALATSDKEGTPRVIAVADVKIISKNELMIGDNYMRFTKKNILGINKVSLVVWDNSKGSKAEGYQLDGTSIYYDSGKWLKRVKEVHGNNAKGAIIVKVNKISKLLE